MPRIRTIKPEFFLDEELARFPAHARLLFLGLWTQADREGRLPDCPMVLKGALFPFEKVDVEALLKLLVPHFIVRYSSQGHRYIQVVNFSKHQRPNLREAVSCIPSPSKSDFNARASTCKHVQVREFHVGKGKGKEGERKENPPTPLPGFTDFWQSWPVGHRVAKVAAARAWKQLDPSIELQARILASVAAFSASDQWQRDGGRYVPHPATWLHQRRWEDESPPDGSAGPVMELYQGPPRDFEPAPPPSSEENVHAERD